MVHALCVPVDVFIVMDGFLWLWSLPSSFSAILSTMTTWRLLCHCKPILPVPSRRALVAFLYSNILYYCPPITRLGFYTPGAEIIRNASSHQESGVRRDGIFNVRALILLFCFVLSRFINVILIPSGSSSIDVPQSGVLLKAKHRFCPPQTSFILPPHR